MDKRWTLAIVTIIMVLLVYSFLSLVLKKDKKRTVSSRAYRDYSRYSKKNDYEDRYYSNNRIYSSSTEARKIKRSLLSNIGTVSTTSYNHFMNAAFSKVKNDNNSRLENNSKYQEMKRLSNIPLPELQSAIALYRNGEYEDAILQLNQALEKLDPMEMQKRIEILSLLAESYLKLKDDDGYIQNKIRQVRIQRKYNKALREISPNYPPYEFISTQEASTNLLRIKSSVSKLPDSPMVREMVKKAELDLEVARKVSQ